MSHQWCIYKSLFDSIDPKYNTFMSVVMCLRVSVSSLHLGRAKNGTRAKKVQGRGWGREKNGTLARKPLDFEKRPLVFTVEFIY